MKKILNKLTDASYPPGEEEDGMKLEKDGTFAMAPFTRIHIGHNQYTWIRSVE